MPELRRNPLTDAWVVIAPERATRPDRFRSQQLPPSGADPADCPFCPGNEGLTPPEVARIGPGDPDTPGWRARAFPNLYPIVEGPRPDFMPLGTRFHESTRATGAHEVVVFSPDHHRALADLTGVQVEEVFSLIRDRVAAHLDAGREYVQVLVNYGRQAGASLDHPHAQLLAIDVVPPAVALEAVRLAGSRECLLCRGVQEDADAGSPFVVSRHGALVWCPWWSGVPFEMIVAPRRHGPRFDHAGPEVGEVARSLAHAMALLRRVVGDVPYNLVLHSSPSPTSADFHWHLHVWPRLTIQAGFEQGTGILVNVVPPEQAAEALRGAQAGD